MLTDNIALFDMDGSLADYTGALVRDLETLRSPDEPKITAENVWKLEELPHIKARMRCIKRMPGWWFNLEPIELGMAVLEASRNMGYNNQILTKGPTKIDSAWSEKLRWCQSHVGENAYVHVTCGKGGQYGKILYDDYPEFMDAWLAHRPRGLGIMPVNAYNKHYSHPNVIMLRGVEDLPQVFATMKLCLDRKSGESLVIVPRG